MSPSPQRQDDIDAAAADWTARLGGGALTEDERRALVRWMARSPAHRAALAEARAAWAQMCRLGPDGLEMELPPLPAHTRPAWNWARAAALAASVLIAMLTGVAYWCGDPLTLLAADHRTDPGRMRTVTLMDGSVVRLGPASAIAVRYGAEFRRVELLSGQADFTAAPLTASEKRPFVVAAGDGTARALGTRFMVDRLPDAVEVTVAEHTVEVALPDASGRVARVLVNPGQAVRYGQTRLGPVASVRYGQAAAWQEGTLVFDRVPLSEVAAILNRYRRDRIVIGDTALAARTVSGVFTTTDPAATLDTITRVLGIRSASLPPLATLLY
ncbi:MAG: FecR domain-containing protein [Magnetospirillum sp.]|nr:FecR domain-containing protein [Magnetospirillum sp.]